MTVEERFLTEFGHWHLFPNYRFHIVFYCLVHNSQIPVYVMSDNEEEKCMYVLSAHPSFGQMYACKEEGGGEQSEGSNPK